MKIGKLSEQIKRAATRRGADGMLSGPGPHTIEYWGYAAEALEQLLAETKEKLNVAEDAIAEMRRREETG